MFGEKRYQVFVSSTFVDLQEERKEVIQALLELDCIPVGMEFFPAADEQQWSLIQKVIDDCDYYIVVIAGRYGTPGPMGKSYTQMEYEYALERGVPVLGFIHGDPGSISAKYSESEPEARRKLEDFKGLVKQKSCKFWTNAAELGGAVTRSVIHAMRTSPRVGWVRANKVASEEAAQDVITLRKKIDEQTAELERLRTAPPRGAENLAQGDEVFNVRFEVGWKRSPDIWAASWNELLKLFGPYFMTGMEESQMRGVLMHAIWDRFRHQFEPQKFRADDVGINAEDLQQIKLQFHALGIIELSAHVPPRWKLTYYGLALLTQVAAMRVPD